MYVDGKDDIKNNNVVKTLHVFLSKWNADEIIAITFDLKNQILYCKT